MPKAEIEMVELCTIEHAEEEEENEESSLMITRSKEIIRKQLQKSLSGKEEENKSRTQRHWSGQVTLNSQRENKTYNVAILAETL